jgi:lipoyl(octanoyl) transferase
VDDDDDDYIIAVLFLVAGHSAPLPGRSHRPIGHRSLSPALSSLPLPVSFISPFIFRNMPSPQTIVAAEEVCERLKVMIRQESDYMIPDYLTPAWQAGLAAAEVSDPSTTDNNGDEPSPSSSEPINVLWRDKICEWCYNLVDHYELARESVSVAMNIVDRYVSSRFITPKTYTIVAVTAIHIAIKLVSPWKLRMNHLLDLCAGKYTAGDIASMELVILNALSWRVHPPSAFDFCGELIDSSFTESTPDALNDLQDKARYLTELAVIDYFFVTKLPSSVALAAIMNALELTRNQVDPRDKDRFTSRVGQVGLDASDEEVIQCYTRLRVMYRNNTSEEEEEPEVGGRGQGSPTGVGELANTPSKKRKRIQEDKEGRLITEHGEEIARFEPV